MGVLTNENSGPCTPMASCEELGLAEDSSRRDDDRIGVGDRWGSKEPE